MQHGREVFEQAAQPRPVVERDGFRLEAVRRGHFLQLVRVSARGNDVQPKCRRALQDELARVAGRAVDEQAFGRGGGHEGVSWGRRCEATREGGRPRAKTRKQDEGKDEDEERGRGKQKERR